VVPPARQPPQRHEQRQPPEQSRTPELVVGELLVEDVSIDGMCGVY
jgi:mycofactocin precursor